MRFAHLTAISLLLAACDRQPVAPDPVSAPQLQATRSVVTNTFDLVDDPSDCTANPRIGEFLLFTGRITFVFYTTTASSGAVDLTAFGTYDAGAHVVGQTSGRVWMVDAARTQGFFHDNVHGAGESYTGVANEYYTNASGAQLHLRGNEKLTLNANGTIVVNRPLAWNCIGG